MICEILDEKGSSAKLPDLLALAGRHGLKAGTIESLIAHRLKHDRIVQQTAEAEVEVGRHGTFSVKVFASLVEPVEHVALVKGDGSSDEPVLVRVQVSDSLSDILALEIDGAGSGLKEAIDIIGKAGRGVVVLIRSANPRVLEDWVRAHASEDIGLKAPIAKRQIETGLGSQILSALGVRKMVLLSRTIPNDYAGLKAFGLDVVEERTFGKLSKNSGSLA